MMATDIDLDMDDIQKSFDDATLSQSPPWHEPTIRCPSCETDIKLTESLAAPLVEALRAKYEQKLARQQADIAKRETMIREKEATLEQAKQAIDQQIDQRVAKKLNEERTRIAAREALQARQLVETELQERVAEIGNLQEVLKQRDVKLAEAQKAQAELVRKQQELDDAKREMELTIATRIRESLDAERQKGKQQAEDELKLTVLEKELQIAGMQKTIEELRRKAEQGSQQLQGEVQEAELESVLRARFPHDTIDPVPKGEHGGDVLHCVVTPAGLACGKILWEAKRTKNWSDGWLPKLREDQRTAKAEIAVIVSQALPKGLNCFDLVDGVWVVSPQVALPIASALREFLMGLTLARQAREGQQTKIAQVYEYLTGPEFRHHVEAILEKTSDLHADLKKERDFMTKQWAKREKHIRQVGDSMLGIYGDLQGIAGKTLIELENLDVKMLADERGDSDLGDG
jgi:hypothetical protein